MAGHGEPYPFPSVQRRRGIGFASIVLIQAVYGNTIKGLQREYILEVFSQDYNALKNYSLGLQGTTSDHTEKGQRLITE